MSNLETGQNNNVYLSIVQGSLRQTVPEGTKDAVRREWEAGGDKGVKHELVFNAVTGKIVGVSFFEGESGGRKFQNLNIRLDENESGKSPVISTGVGTRYAQDILKKLPNVDFDEEVRIRPYSFIPEGEDKAVTGVEITQRNAVSGNFENKITGFFHKKNAKGKWDAINGFPIPEGKTDEYTSDDWDIFYKQARRFLVNYTKENICPKFERQPIPKSYEEEQARRGVPEKGLEEAADAVEEGIDPADIPF